MIIRLSEADQRRLAAAEFTYPEVGATHPDSLLPPGYHHLTEHRRIGSGPAAFDAAVTDLFSWQVYPRCHIPLAVSTDTASVGAIVRLGIGVAPLRLLIPCRVVYVLDEARRKGWAYGTLPGHPESGEESFYLEHGADEQVTFSIRAFSRPGSLLTRLAPAPNRWVQGFMTKRYLNSLDPHGHRG